MGDQLVAFKSASNPEANNAHITVNIASLPSTVTVVAGAACHLGCRGGTGSCAGVRSGSNVAMIITNTKIHDLVFIPFRLILRPAHFPEGSIRSCCGFFC
jgi:hypothetical protein